MMKQGIVQWQLPNSSVEVIYDKEEELNHITQFVQKNNISSQNLMKRQISYYQG